MKKFLLILFLFFISLEASGFKEHRYSRDLKDLKLSKIQIVKMRSIIKKYRHNIKKYIKAKEKTQKEIKLIFNKNSFDIKFFYTINIKLYKRAFILEANFLKKIHSVLSIKQRKIFLNYINEWEMK